MRDMSPSAEMSPTVHAERTQLLRRIDSIDGKLAVLIRQRHRSQKALISLREATV